MRHRRLLRWPERRRDLPRLLPLAKKHAELGRKALNEKDREKADEMWKEILPRIPAYGKAAASESLLTTAAAASALVFPDRPITPQKPGGFA